MFGLTKEQEIAVFHKVERDFLKQDFDFYVQAKLYDTLGSDYGDEAVLKILDEVDFDYLCNRYEDEYSVSFAKEDIIIDIVKAYLDDF